MAITNCPHCKADVPPGFDAMPVCMMCGGDLNATPSGAGWAAIDTKQDNSRICPSCNAEVKSVFALECPECKAALVPVGEVIADPVPLASLEEERERLEHLIQEPVAAEPVAAAPPPAPEPVVVPEPAKPTPEPVAAGKPAALELPPFVDKPIERPVAEPKVAEPEPKPTPVPAAKEGFFAKLLRMLGLKKD